MADHSSDAYGDKGLLVLGITWTEAGLAMILVGLRAKTASVCQPGQSSKGIFGLRWDCFWVIIALTLSLCAQSFMTVSAVYGLGNHERVLSASNIVKTNLWSWIAQIVAIISLVVARIAVISFLLALQGPTHWKAKWPLYIIGALQGVINVVEVVLILMQCDPVQKLWDPTVPGTCDLIVICSRVGFLQGSIGAASDLILAFYPVYIIGRLQQMKTSLKISLCLVMSGGIVAGIAGINKTIAIASITETSDITYVIYSLNTWVLTEMWFIIIFGSIPVLRPVFIRFAQSVKTASAHTQEELTGSAYLTSFRKPGDTWVALADKNYAGASRVSAHSKTSYKSRHGESEEEILPTTAQGQISRSASRDATANQYFNSKASHETSRVPKKSFGENSKDLVPNNYGSTTTVVEHLPMERSSSAKRQELRREESVDGQIQVTRKFAITYEDHKNQF